MCVFVCFCLNNCNQYCNYLNKNNTNKILTKTVWMFENPDKTDLSQNTETSEKCSLVVV